MQTPKWPAHSFHQQLDMLLAGCAACPAMNTKTQAPPTARVPRLCQAVTRKGIYPNTQPQTAKITNALAGRGTSHQKEVWQGGRRHIDDSGGNIPRPNLADKQADTITRSHPHTDIHTHSPNVNTHRNGCHTPTSTPDTHFVLLGPGNDAPEGQLAPKLRRCFSSVWDGAKQTARVPAVVQWSRGRYRPKYPSSENDPIQTQLQKRFTVQTCQSTRSAPTEVQLYVPPPSTVL